MQLRGWGRSVFFVVCYLCSHTGTSSTRRGLLAPVGVTTKLVGDQVLVHWRDHNQPGLVSAVYAAVSEVDGDSLGSPVFIHAEDVETNSITLSGLMPQMTYSIRVVIFSRDGHSASSTPVSVTMRSYLLGSDLQPDVGTGSQVVIKVNHVTNHSALLSWKFPLGHSTHGLQFKFNCTGQQAFSMNGRTVYEKYQTKSYMSDALSKFTQEQKIENLVPNVNYTCVLAAYSIAGEKTFLMATAHFTTLVGKPRTPEKPRVDARDSGIKIFLTATTDQFGPISHYTLISVPVHKDKGQPITVPFTPLIPYNKVVGEAMPSHSASNSDRSVVFEIDTYPGSALPSEVVLGNTNEVLSAFKPNQYYVLVLAAFTKTKENPKSLYSLSSPSFPPFVISSSLYTYATQHAKEKTVGEASRMVMWTAVTIAFCGIAVIISVFGMAYVLKKTGYKIPLKWSDEDVDSGDDVELTADKLVYGEKTYVPMKPVRSDQSARVASEAVDKYDNPHFDTSVSRTKGLLEDIQVTMDCTEVSPATENPPQSPNENTQPLTTCTVNTTEIPPVKSTKKLNYSPFTYSTPGELEKLQTGTFFLPRSTGPIKTPRRKPVAVKSLVKGIPTPVPCKLTTLSKDEEPNKNNNDKELNNYEEFGNTEEPNNEEPDNNNNEELYDDEEPNNNEEPDNNNNDNDHEEPNNNEEPDNNNDDNNDKEHNTEEFNNNEEPTSQSI